VVDVGGVHGVAGPVTKLAKRLGEDRRLAQARRLFQVNRVIAGLIQGRAGTTSYGAAEAESEPPRKAATTELNPIISMACDTGSFASQQSGSRARLVLSLDGHLHGRTQMGQRDVLGQDHRVGRAVPL
jgi:hypothetical protein